MSAQVLAAGAPPTLGDPVRARLIADMVTERLEQALLSGELALGSVINEKQLAEQLGVSRSPLREALRSLEGRKLLERNPNVGMRVVSIAADDVREIYLLREVLEGAACRLVVESFTDEDCRQLVALAQVGKREVKANMKSYSFVKDLDFHQRIIVGTGNRRLVGMLTGDLHFTLRVLRSRASKMVARPAEAFDEHVAIARAIAARDAAGAEALMRAHVRAARDELLAAVGDELANKDRA